MFLTGFPVGAVQEDLPASQVMFSIPTSNNSRLLSRQLAQIGKTSILTGNFIYRHFFCHIKAAVRPLVYNGGGN